MTEPTSQLKNQSLGYFAKIFAKVSYFGFSFSLSHQGDLVSVDTSQYILLKGKKEEQ